MPTDYQRRACSECAAPIDPGARADRLTCSARCRQRRHRRAVREQLLELLRGLEASSDDLDRARELLRG